MGVSEAGTVEIGRLFRTRLPAGVVAFAGAALVAALLAAVADEPRWYRLVFALAIASNLLILAVRWPRTAVLATLLFLPFLGLIRRLLIAETGWTSYDPLLMVGPVVAVFLFYRIFVMERRGLGGDTLSKLVFALLALTLLQSFNPTSGSLVAGLGGLMFLGVPLLWFFIGREFADRRTVVPLLYAIVGLAVPIGVYGLWQTEVGLPSWDQSWLDVGGFVALQVFGKIRAFGTFASSSEYAIFLAAALTICVAMLVHGRPLLSLALPFLAVPLFLCSGRTVLILTAFVASLMVGLKARRVGLALVLAVIGVGLTVVTAGHYADPKAGTSGSTQDPLVGHQLGGLANPLDPNRSTLPLHWNLAVDGITEGIRNPLGNGTAVTNLAASRFGIGGTAKSSELDVSNAFISLGVPGGLLFIALLVVAFRRTVSAYLARPDPAVLAALGLMVVTVGQWLNGGYYALAPLLWFVVGWVTREKGDADVGY